MMLGVDNILIFVFPAAPGITSFNPPPPARLPAPKQCWLLEPPILSSPHPWILSRNSVDIFVWWIPHAIPFSPQFRFLFCLPLTPNDRSPSWSPIECTVRDPVEVDVTRKRVNSSSRRTGRGQLSGTAPAGDERSRIFPKRRPWCYIYINISVGCGTVDNKVRWL